MDGWMMMTEMGGKCFSGLNEMAYIRYMQYYVGMEECIPPCRLSRS